MNHKKTETLTQQRLNLNITRPPHENLVKSIKTIIVSKDTFSLTLKMTRYFSHVYQFCTFNHFQVKVFATHPGFIEPLQANVLFLYPHEKHEDSRRFSRRYRNGTLA